MVNSNSSEMWSGFESRSGKIKNNYNNNLPYSTMASIGTFTARRRRIEQEPLRPIIELRRGIKPIFALCTLYQPNLNLLSYR